MLQSAFTAEQNMWGDSCRKLLEIVPQLEAWREAASVDREAFRKTG
jgi:hypothetical protein